MMTPVLKAFLQQNKIDDQGADLRERALREWQDKQYNEACKKIAKAGCIFNLDGSTNIDKNQIHPQFRNYDHSLEQDRASILGIETNSSED